MLSKIGLKDRVTLDSKRSELNSAIGSPGEMFGLDHSNSRRRVTSASSKARYAFVGNTVHYTTGLQSRPKQAELSNRF